MILALLVQFTNNITFLPYSNKAQLRELEHIRTNLLHSKKPLALPAAPNGLAFGKVKPTSIRPFLTMARFIARMRIASRNWAQQEQVRLKLVAARDDQRRVKRSRLFKVVRMDA